MYPVVILCGGRATRLMPLTASIPKSLIDVAGRPFVEHQITSLRAKGADRIILCVGHLGDQIQAVIGDGRRFGVQIQYVADGPRLLGTGGALKLAATLLSGPFFVLYGDSYLQLDYAAAATAFRDSGKAGLMTVFRNDGKWDRSNILFRDGEILQYDKRHPSQEMRHIDYGLSVLRKEALERVPAEAPYDLAQLLEELVRERQLSGYEVFTRFYEIGTPSGLAELRDYLSREGSS